MTNLRENIRKLIKASKYFTEIRFHERKSRTMKVQKSEVRDMSSKIISGVGVRVLVDGTWGFASTSDFTYLGLEKTLMLAEKMALELATRKKEKVVLGKNAKLAKGDFFLKGFEELNNMPMSEKFFAVKNAEQQIAKGSKQIEAAACSYTEIFEEKMILTSDGADAHIKLVRPEMRFLAIAGDGAKKAEGRESVGATGNWECLFQNHKLEECIETAVGEAVDLLKAPPAHGGKKKVILSPAMVGLLSHEAIGHTVEADLVIGGSVALGKIGKTVASSLVNLCDSGISDYQTGAGGELPVDDEGVLTEKTYVIKGGILTSYLHNRESAEKFGVAPTGNARSWEYADEPLIRMRNTYIEPGKDKLEKMISEVEDGYFIDGAGGGQADSTGEFMFGASRVREIKNGKLGAKFQKVTVSGIAFDVLASVDAVSSDFKWDLGAGYCGKGQPAKVDAGGPYIRCELLVGGAQ